MSFPNEVRDRLEASGHVAAETLCHFFGYREFVSVFAEPTSKVMSFPLRFSCYFGSLVLYRVERFRATREIIDSGVTVPIVDLEDFQTVFLPSLDEVARLLEIWNVNPSTLVAPREAGIPDTVGVTQS